MVLIDSHAHLDFVDDLEGVLKRAKAAQVEKIVTIGTSLESSEKAIEIAQKYSSADLQIWATCGLHPKNAKGEIGRLGVNESIHRLKSIAKSSDKVVGVGECGLDYHLTTDNKQLTSDIEKKFQGELFKAQIKLATDLNLPLVVHCRNAWQDIFGILLTVKRELKTKSGVFHSFTGDWQAAKKALDLGFFISFSGIVTFKSTGEIQEVVRKAPIDRMLIETDSPFLSPGPNRGQKNEPRNVKIIARFIAETRNQSIDKISLRTATNAKRLFNLL